MLLDHGFGRPPQQLDVAHSVSDRPLEHLFDETLRLLVESAKGLEDGSGVVVDGDGQVITEDGMKLTAMLPYSLESLHSLVLERHHLVMHLGFISSKR